MYKCIIIYYYYIYMISNKFLQLDPPINIKQNIDNVLFGKKSYNSQKIQDNITTRNVSDDVLDKNNNSGAPDDFFNKVMDDFEAGPNPKDEKTSDLFSELLLSIVDYSGSSEDEDIDSLLKNINSEISILENEIKQIRISASVYFSALPNNSNFDPSDYELITKINKFLEKYKGEDF